MGRQIDDLATHESAHVTLQALANYLGVHRKTVVRWVRWGLLPAYRFPSVSERRGGEWRIKTVDARAFQKRYEFVPTKSDEPDDGGGGLSGPQ